jgi:hypothetical protein
VDKAKIVNDAKAERACEWGIGWRLNGSETWHRAALHGLSHAKALDLAERWGKINTDREYKPVPDGARAGTA